MHYEIQHPCIQDKLTEIRDKDTGYQKFRQLISEITMLLSFSALEGLSLTDVTVETPIKEANCKKVLISHHAPGRSDQDLDRIASSLPELFVVASDRLEIEV